LWSRSFEWELLVRETSEVVDFPSGTDSLDRAGKDVLVRVQRAATTAEQQVQHALGFAREAAMQLKVAEDKIAKLQAEIWGYKDRAERAEQWLGHISQEIEQAFAGVRQQQPEDFAPRRVKVR
jgi:predicted  nucleic acid-binding Zn-ribbon protein